MQMASISDWRGDRAGFSCEGVEGGSEMFKGVAAGGNEKAAVLSFFEWDVAVMAGNTPTGGPFNSATSPSRSERSGSGSLATFPFLGDLCPFFFLGDKVR